MFMCINGWLVKCIYFYYFVLFSSRVVGKSELPAYFLLNFPHRKWQILQQFSLPFTVFKPPQSTQPLLREVGAQPLFLTAGAGNIAQAQLRVASSWLGKSTAPDCLSVPIDHIHIHIDPASFRIGDSPRPYTHIYIMVTILADSGAFYHSKF